MEYLCYDDRMCIALESGNHKLIQLQAMRRLSEEPEDPLGSISMGFLYLLQNRLEDSEQIAEKLTFRPDNHVSALGWYLLSRCAHVRGDMDKALDYVYKCFSLSPDNNTCYEWAALYHLVRKEYSLASAFANKVLRQAPEEVFSLAIQALAVYLDQGIVATEEHLDSIIALEPENPIPYFYRGRLEQEQQRIDRAQYWFEKCLELNPEFLWAQRVLSEMETP